MKAQQQDGRVEIVAGRWHISVATDEAHAIRCAVADHLIRFMPPDAVVNKPSLGQLIFDTATEYDETLAKCGVGDKSIWLEVGDLKVVLRPVQALRLWRLLDELGRVAPSRKSNRQSDDVDDLLDEDWKREMGL